MKLFAVLLGGRANGCNIELHDVVFVTGNTLEEAYPKLIKKWFGDKKRLHIDSSIELHHVDGYKIVLSPTKEESSQNKLYFVNFGGYKKGFFGEVHEANFYVAISKDEVKARAKKELCLSTLEQHCDDNVDIDDILSIDQIDQHYVTLIPSNKCPPLDIQSVYRKLDLPHIMQMVE